MIVLKKDRFRPLYLFIACFGFLNLMAQSDSGQVKINVLYNNQAIVLDKYYPINEGNDSLKIENLKFYISDVSFLNKDEVLHEFSQKYTLIDAEKENLTIPFQANGLVAPTHIKFSIGVDSLTNESGAYGGDLDPTKGMYWTWQSGYINFKLEGKSSLCDTRNNVFQYHIGGYQDPHYALRTFTVPIEYSEQVIIELDLYEFLNKVGLENNAMIMSPSDGSMQIADLFSNFFKKSK